MKCLPICFGVNIEKNIPIFFGAFYKFLHHCQQNNWPILAQEEYFENPTIQEKKYPIKLKNVSEINDIPNIKSIKLEEKYKYIITNEETELVLKNYSTKDEAWISLMYKKDKNLYEILDKKLGTIIEKYKDIKYIIVWRYNETINQICIKYGIRLINMEMSGFRKNSYRFTLCYFQHIDKYQDKEFNERYEKFTNELKTNKVKMLTRDQLINLMVSKNELNNMVEEEYYTGFAMGLAKDYDTIATKSKINNEILKELTSFEKKSTILIRKHPANYHYKYDHEKEFVLDHSVSSIQFISRCHRIVSSVSNIGMEAMLLGKTCYVLGEMPFRRFGYQSLEYNDEYVISMQDLNFLIFGYLVPYEISLTKEYLDFREKNPTEIEIYNYHYNYIMSKYGKKINSKMIKSRNQKWIENKKREKEIEEKCICLETELNSILNSKSWKLTGYLRKIMRIIRRK